MSNWPNIQGLCLVLALLLACTVGIWAAIENAQDQPPERDGRFDVKDYNAHREEANLARRNHR